MMIKSLSSTRLCCRELMKYEYRNLHTTAALDVKNYYEILGLQRSASDAEIKSAFYEKAKIYHPDTNKTNVAVKNFQEISEAYEILGDKAKRRAYDSNTRYDSSYNDYMRQKEKTYPRPSTPNPTTKEPLSMTHIRHVYETLNKEENEEPKFRPFEDHNYPESPFNRFEYRRQWDSDKKVWVYSKRLTADDYNKKMEAKGKILRRCTLGLMGFFALFIYLKSLGPVASLSQLLGKERLEGKFVIVNGRPKRLDDPDHLGKPV